MASLRCNRQQTAVYEKTRLANGARVITETIPSVRSIAVGIWVHTGSRDEEPSVAGISHLIEHMVFKGTARRRTHQIARRLESVGGFLNAFTSKEHTCYYARALDSHLARAIDTVCDLVLDPVFPPKELVKEKAVILEEMKMYEDSPEDVIFEHFESIVYPDHAFGRPVIGFQDTVSALSRDDLLGYMDQRYTPNRMVLAVAGNVRHNDAVRLAERSFHAPGRIPRNGERHAVGGYRPAESVQSRPIQQAHLIVGRRGIDVHSPWRTPMTVLNTILGGGMSSRLNQNIREKYGYCYNIYSFVNMYSDTGDTGVYIGTDASHTDHGRKLIMREFDRLVQKPVSARTLTQAKNQVKGQLMLGLESMSNRMMRIAQQELLFGRYITLDEVLDDLDSVTVEDIQSTAQFLYDAGEYSSVVLLPQT